jgi:protein-disulfide isomerase
VARTSSQRNPLTPFYIVLAVVALGGVIFLLTQLRGSGDVAANAPVPVDIDPAELSRVQGISLGRADAPVVMYEFADFQCPHCAEWVTFVEPLLRERLVNTGVVRYVFYDFPLGGSFRHSFLAARAGRCANEQGKFWEYHDLVFGRQQTWSPMDDPADFFVELGGQAGVPDTDAFESCVRSDKYVREVTLSRQLGDQLGVGGTPTLFVNGKRIPQVPSNFSELEAIVRQEAGTAGGAPAAGDSATADSAPAGS